MIKCVIFRVKFPNTGWNPVGIPTSPGRLKLGPPESPLYASFTMLH